MPPHVGTPTNSNSSLPLYHSVLLSISGDSKISLQHTSVQQLSAIPEDRELSDEKQRELDDDTQFQPQLIVEDEFDEPHVLIQDPAPDGGYGWIIVLASFFCNLIVDGIAYTFGLFFEQFVTHFDTSKSKVALCGSLLNGFYLSVGPLVSSLANRFGCRIVTIFGAIIAFVAFSLSTIAPNIETMYITYGFLGGVGMGMIFLPAIVSVGYYFTTKRALATGIAVCGSGVGTFLFSPFCQYLLGVTTWQNTLLILSFMILFCAAFGSLMRPLNVHAEAVLAGDIDQQQCLQSSELRKPLLQRIAEEKRRRLLAHSNSQFLLMMQNGSLDLNDLTFTELKNRLTMNMEPGVHSTLYLDQLFQQSPTPTTPSVSAQCPSTNQSQSQLCPDTKHQLSPIIEGKQKKIFSVSSSDDNSSDDVTIKENADNQEDTETDKNDDDEDAEETENIQVEVSDEKDQNNEDKVEAAENEPIVPRKFLVEKVEESTTETETKSDATTPESPTIILPQSPISETGRTSAMTGNSISNLRSRRSTMRTTSEVSNSGQVDSVSLLPSTNLLPTSQMNGLGQSGQLPIQVILSTTPTNHKESKDGDSKRNISAQVIPVRPISKKDIFYSGSTLHVPSSMQHLAESIGANMGQSIVSIPARDIIAKVQKQIQKQDNNDNDIDEDDTGFNKKLQPNQKKNVCDKILGVLCSFKDDCCRKSQVANSSNNNELDQTELGDFSETNKLKQHFQPDDMDDDNNNNNGNQKSKPVGCWGRFIQKLPPSMGTILNEMLDFSLLRESNAFTILAISNIFGMMGFYVPFVYITQFATSSVKNGDGKYVTKDQAAILISVIGITNTFGRLLFGYLSDRITRNGSICGFKITALGLNNICVILSGLAVMMAPYCKTYYLVILDCVLFGLFISAYVCLTSVILVDMLGLDKLTNAFGLLCLFRGFASMIGPPLAGALFDVTQSYPITFAASGILLIVSSIMAFFINPHGDHTADQDFNDEANACDV